MCFCVYLSLQSLVESASNHASGVGLDGDDSPQSVSKGLAHQKAPTATLEAHDSLTSHMIRCTHLPGTNQGLKPRETCSHLEDKKKKKIGHKL